MENKIKIRVIPSSSEFKVLDASGNSGDVLKKHQVNINGLLLVREGTINYVEATRQQQLTAGDCLDIPANTVHEVTCIDNAKFFVVLPKQTKMKFEK